MPLPHVHHVFLQRTTTEGCEERSFLDGRSNDVRAQRVDAPYVVRRRGTLERVRGGVAWLLKNAARLVYVSPALLIVKVILKLFDDAMSDLTIVIFVLIVVLFFAVLNLYLFVSILWWLVGRAPQPFSLKPPFDADGREELPLLDLGDLTDVGDAPLPAGRLVRARGAIVRLGPNSAGDGTVVHDLWDEGLGLRLTECIDFAVVGQGRIPVVLRLSSAPIVIAKPEPIHLDAYLSQATPETARLVRQEHGEAANKPAPCALLTLREGDEVEVIGGVTGNIDNVDNFELEGTYASVPLHAEQGDGGASPFRDKPGGPGLMIAEGVILIRKVAREQGLAR
jgi:hypothetical protein